MLTKYFSLLAISLLGFNSGSENKILAPEQAVIYLTFDDGPVEGSENVNDVVWKERIKVDAFLVGKHALLSSANVERYGLYMDNRYVECCNHSFCHGNLLYMLFYSRPLRAYDDFAINGVLLELNNNICRLPGCNVWRLPGRSFDKLKLGRATADLLVANGARVFGWDIEWDYSPRTIEPTKTPDEMVALIDSAIIHHGTFTPGHIVVLCHDQMFKGSSQKLQLFEFIGKLKATGKYRFEHLKNYPDAGGHNVNREVSK